MTPQAAEAAVLDQLIPSLQAEGYQVFVHPRRELLPAFLEGFQPDAIALGDKKNLAIEITSSSRNSDDKLRRIEDRFKGQSDWELRLIWVSPASVLSEVTSQSPASIVDSIAQVKELVDRGYPGPALLIAWATFEALARAMRPKSFIQPQTPGRLVQELAQEGTLTPTEADFLRFLAKQRNALIHGEITTKISGNQVVRFAEILESLIADKDDDKTPEK